MKTFQLTQSRYRRLLFAAGAFILVYWIDPVQYLLQLSRWVHGLP